jgi:hypothetical protein
MMRFGAVRAGGIRTGNGNMRRRGVVSGSRNLGGNIRRSTFSRSSGFRATRGLRRPHIARYRVARISRRAGGGRLRMSLRVL